MCSASTRPTGFCATVGLICKVVGWCKECCDLPVTLRQLMGVWCCCCHTGGRNATLGLRSASGYFRRTSVVGLAVFTGYWYWYPLRYENDINFSPKRWASPAADTHRSTIYVCSCQADMQLTAPGYGGA